MNEFIEERARLVRILADKADPFTKVRLVKLAEKYDEQLGLGTKPERQYKIPVGLPQISIKVSGCGTVEGGEGAAAVFAR